jgi:luciferase family oxidoreductase group 1
VPPTLRLSVLDQSPIPAGCDAADAFANTVDLARFTEALGYTRYWVAEHHGAGGLAGSAPEILVAHLAAVTSTIRVGSGGVMLPHYSPLKVAEQFGLLETLHPGRIDLGIGRAPGSDRITSVALQRNRRTPVLDDFAEQIAELRAWFEGSFPDHHPFGAIAAAPIPAPPPPIWLLTSSGWSARAAASVGVGVAFAHFITPAGGPEAMARYRLEFVPAYAGDLPRTAVGVNVICADSDGEADRVASSARLWRHRISRLGIRGPVPTVEEALADPYQPDRPERAASEIPTSVVGSPERARAEIEAIAAAYGVDEVIVVSITHDHAARRRSYELLAQIFELPTRLADEVAVD